MKPTDADNPGELESAETASQQLPRRSRRWWLLRGIPTIVAAAIAVAAVFVFRDLRPVGISDSGKSPAQLRLTPSEETVRRPVIPLEILFPEESAGRSGGPGQSGAGEAAAGPASAPEAAIPIPATPEAVVSESRRLAEELTRRFPGNADVLAITGKMGLWLGDLDKAQPKKSESAGGTSHADEKSDSDMGGMRVKLAQWYTTAGRLCLAHRELAEAERYCRRAAALDPEAVDCRQAIAWFCQRDGRTREAIATLRQLSELDRANSSYLLEIGRLAEGTAEYDEAEGAYQKVCDAFPDSADGFASLAKLCLKTGRHPERVESLANMAASLEPSLENCLVAAAACERSGNVSGAAAAMERVIKLEPNRPDYQRMYQELVTRVHRPSQP